MTTSHEQRNGTPNDITKEQNLSIRAYATNLLNFLDNKLYVLH